MLTLMGFGLTSLSGVRRGFMPPQLKTKQELQNRRGSNDDDAMAGIISPNGHAVHLQQAILYTKTFSRQFTKLVRQRTTGGACG